MAERLVVDIYDSKANENKIAALYYHWSACDRAAAQYELDDIINWVVKEELNNKTNIREMQLSLIRFAESRGGGITGDNDFSEYNYIKALFPKETFKQTDIDRNKGLIALSPEGIHNFEIYTNGAADIYIIDRESYNWVGSFEDEEEATF